MMSYLDPLRVLTCPRSTSRVLSLAPWGPCSTCASSPVSHPQYGPTALPRCENREGLPGHWPGSPINFLRLHSFEKLGKGVENARGAPLKGPSRPCGASLVGAACEGQVGRPHEGHHVAHRQPQPERHGKADEVCRAPDAEDVVDILVPVLGVAASYRNSFHMAPYSLHMAPKSLYMAITSRTDAYIASI